MRMIDLTAPIVPSRPEAVSFEKVEIRFTSHAEGAGQIEALLHVPRHLLRNGEGWAVEEFTRLATHSVTHVDAPWHYNSVIQGQRASPIDELPLEWFHAPGVVVDMTAKGDGERIEAGDVEAALAGIGHVLRPLDIVLIRTGRDVYYGQSDYIFRGPAVSPEATRWLFDRGVRVMGIDAWGWDGPLDRQARDALARQEAGRILGGPPVRPALFADRAAGEPRRPARRRVHRELFPAEDPGRQHGPTRAVAILEAG